MLINFLYENYIIMIQKGSIYLKDISYNALKLE